LVKIVYNPSNSYTVCTNKATGNEVLFLL